MNVNLYQKSCRRRCDKYHMIFLTFVKQNYDSLKNIKIIGKSNVNIRQIYAYHSFYLFIYSAKHEDLVTIIQKVKTETKFL